MIALVWNAPVKLVHITVRYEPMVEGLRSLGVEALTVCPSETEEGYPYPVRTFENESEIAEVTFWKELGCNAIVIITWHRMTNILSAAKSAGMKTLAIGESDGRISVRYHPWDTYRYMTSMQPSIRKKIGAAKYWLKRYLLEGSKEHKALVENVKMCDAFTLAGQGGVQQFKNFLKKQHANDCANKVSWLPYPIDQSFCNGSVEDTRARRVIAIGRWGSPQKNASLLESTIRKLANRNIEFVIVGRGSIDRFSSLSNQVSNVIVMEPQPRDRIRELMATSRSILIPSLWESGPIVANEMLALGGTIIGTPIVNLKAITADSRFGHVSASFHSEDLAAAIVSEMEAWDRGERHPQEIADYWRNNVSPSAVARRMLNLLD